MSWGSSRLPLIAGAGSAAVLALSIVAYTHLTREAPTPAAPESAAGGEAVTLIPLTGAQKCSLPYYEERLKTDATRYGVAQVTLSELRRPLSGGVEWSGARVLSKQHPLLETPHLKLSVGAQKIYPNPKSGQMVRVEHLTLSIQNRTGAPLAYRVRTEVAGGPGCEMKGNLPHNAIALRPHETLTRSECLSGAERTLTVTGVEVYELSELGYRYVSRLTPVAGPAFDPRVAAGHSSPGDEMCVQGSGHEREGDNPAAWHAMIDFYARHNCEEYTMPASYRPFQTAGRLPACEESPPSPSQGEDVATAAATGKPPHGDEGLLARHGLALAGVALLGMLAVLLWPRRRGQRRVQGKAPQQATALEFDNDEKRG